MSVNDKNKPGCIRICHFPLTDKVFEIQSHNAGITHLAMAHEDKYMFSASEDGTLIVYDVRTMVENDVKKEIEEMSIEIAEDYLIDKKEFDKKLLEVSQLDKKNHELKIKNMRAL